VKPASGLRLLRCGGDVRTAQYLPQPLPPRPHQFQSTFCFNFSNQFGTTLICVGAAFADSLGLSIKKR
jgi:hypothetical protein